VFGRHLKSYLCGSHGAPFPIFSTALRRVQNLLRHDVNKLQAENTQLHISVDELETKVNQYVSCVYPILD